MIELLNLIKTAKTDKTHIFSLGQAGFIIRSKSGELLAIDPYLSNCVEIVEGNIGFKRLLPKIIEPSNLDLDVLICTHFHRDHYDIESVPTLMQSNNVNLFCAYDCKQDVLDENIDLSKVTFVKPGDMATNGAFKLNFINCDHGTGAPQAVGVIIEVDGKKIVEVGDTCLRLDRVDEILSRGPVDVMIAPINGAYGNLNEEECAKLADAIKPKITIPCHYGMFASHGGNPGLFHQIMRQNYPANKYLLMAQGEQFSF